MMWRDVVDLITTKHITDSDGFSKDVPDVRKDIYANKKSIRQSEFYQSYALGIKLDIMIEINTADYNGEELLEYESQMYRIVRTYSKNGEIVELLCTAVKDDI